jgi:ribose transport system permease protein
MTDVLTPSGEAEGAAIAAKRIRVQEIALPFVLLVLVVAGFFIDADIFFTKDNLFTILTQASVVGVIAIGMTFVIATGGIDLSVGSVLAAAAVAGGQLEPQGSLAFILATIAFAALLGLVNGIAIAWGRIVPFIATLAMLLIARGIALWWSDKTPISVSLLDTVRTLGRDEVVGVPIPAIIFVALTGLGWVVLNRTTFGRHVVAVGGNREAARIAGIRPNRIVCAVYVISGVSAGIAAVLLSGRLGSASPVAGSLLELDAIAAVVIGGTSLAGGRATITGTFLGVITFAVIFNLLNLLEMPAEAQQVAKGLIILAAAAIQRRDA